MTIPINTTLTVEFDPKAMDLAANEIGLLREKYGEQADEVLDGLFVVLSFMRLEKAAPGTIGRIFEATRQK